MPKPQYAQSQATEKLGAILLIEDNRGDAMLIEDMLAQAEETRRPLVHVDRLTEALSVTAEDAVDIILADLSLPDSAGLETVTLLQQYAPRTPIIVLTGSNDRELALSALKEGAQDYLVKDQVTPPGLVKAIHYALERKQAELRLRESESRYKSLFYSVPDAILLLRDGRIVDCNAHSAAIFGYPQERLQGLTPATLSPSRQPDASISAEQFRNHLSMAQQGEPQWFEWEFQRADNALVSTEVILDRILLNGRQHVLAIVRDLTERKQAEHRIRFQASLLNQVHNAVFATDEEDRIIYWNSHAGALYQWEPEEAMGRRPRELIVSEKTQEQLEAIHEALVQEGNWEGELDLQRRDHSTFPALVTISAIRNEYNRLAGYAVVASDITERKEVERKLEHNAFHDALTSLPNRALFEDRLSRAIAKGTREGGHYAVLMMDLDRFKVINDSLGHMVGDELLIQFSRRVESCLRPGDTLARLGGDEFTVLLEDIQHSSDAIRVAERIHEKMSQPFLLGQQEIYTSTSIGITFGTANYHTPEEALRDADIAMYRAKGQGKGGHVIFEQGMHEKAVTQLRRETRIRQALENGEFRVHYLPIVDLESGHCTGTEALLRWPGEEGQPANTRELIDTAEESGLMITVGQEVFLQACQELTRWREAGIDGSFSLHFNLTTKQFCHRGLAKQLQQIIDRYAIPPDSITLEVAESVLTEHPVLASAALGDLHDLRVRICVDHFGSGDSLAYLQRFAVDAIKIDRSFVSQVDHSATCGAIVQALVGLGNSLHIQTIAEGIEKEAQLAKVKQLGCRYGQGFFLQAPLDASQMNSYLRQLPA